jgi:isopenicillin-N epimerase
MPTFGRSMLDGWLLDPRCTYLNHGTVGAPPRRVLAKQQALRDEMERHPSRFILRELHLEQPAPWRVKSRLREALDEIAPFVGARADDLAFVPNITTGMNAVLRSFPLAPGDEVVITELAYGGIVRTAKSITRERGATLRTVEMPFPLVSEQQIVDAVAGALTAQTKLVVVDHVTAQTALVMPVAAVTALCHQHGVPVAVDGAHAPGSIAVDIPALGADWYCANLHKWAHAPRSCGILWARPEHQPFLHHPIASWGYDGGFHEEFDHVATNDPTSFLAAPEGIAILQEWGFGDVLAYMHALAWDAGQALTACWGSWIDAPRAMIGAMVTVPLPESAGSTVEEATALRLKLLVEDHIEVPIHPWHGRLWTRVSTQVYNDRSDIERLAAAVKRRCS